MTPHQIRKQFADHCGSVDQYRRFLESFNRKARQRGRLAFWQQRLWDSFAEIHPELTGLTVADLVPAFRLCHVHMVPLVDRDVPIDHDLIDVRYSPDYEKAWAERFPYAVEFLIDSPAFEGKSHLTVDHCNECWSEMKRFNSRYSSP